MDIHIRFTIDAPRGWTRRVLLYVAMPIALVAGASAVASALDKSWIGTGKAMSASKLLENMNEIEARFAGTEPCPVGYAKDPAPAVPWNAESIVCKKGNDEVVKVGTGPSSFWIDRYEASVWVNPDGTGGQKFATQDDSTVSFPKNGQVVTPLYALSVAGVTPARIITWFQAVEACTASGKRLPTGSEWLRAARGTADPTTPNDGTAVGNTKCNTGATAPRSTGDGLGGIAAVSCTSDWGAQDMIGNLTEYTEEWYAGLYDVSGGGAHTWPDLPNGAFNADATWNISSYAVNPGPGWTQGIPAVGLRGGDFSFGTGAGVFSLFLSLGPVTANSGAGFRCVIAR